MTNALPPQLTWQQVCARRLHVHALSQPAKGVRPAEIVTAMAGTHAQVMSAAELGIALRIEGSTRVDVRHALWNDHSLIKTFGPRGTVHLLPADELATWTGALSALPPGISPFPESVRMSPDQTEAVVEAIGTALLDAELTVDELTEAVADLAGSWAADPVIPAFQTYWPRWRQVQHLAGHRGTLCFGPNRGRNVTYTNPRRWLPSFRPAPAEEALPRLLRSYLRAYGPSTPQRFAHWLNAPVSWARAVFESAAGELCRVDVEGNAAWLPAGEVDLPYLPDVPGQVPSGVRLLPYFDGYAYRVGNQPPEHLYPGRAADRVLGGNFQVLLVDGVVGGLWHQRRSGRRIAITVEPVVDLTAAQREDLDLQVRRVGEVLQGNPTLTIGRVTVGGHG
ncbi:winged helix DNA-binding domain-containing protein [Actinopolymorpha sp. NPDC004070]|uniref:winged helix DNA-binding domain-containing protein n=1 Tax=Actinopolymorpha sp. NPDC004070 TaxID=3154548 RepID=UPI0033B1253B